MNKLIKNLNISSWLKNNILGIHSIFVIVFLLLIILTTNIIQNKVGNSYSLSKIQNIIIEKETEIDYIINKFKSSDKDINYKNFFTENDIVNYSNQNISFFLFYQDKLVNWTDNAVLPEYTDKISENTAIVEKLNDGYYLTKRTINKEFTLVGLFLLENEYIFENEYLKNTINSEFNIKRDINFSYANIDSQTSIYNINKDILFSVDYNKGQHLNNQNTLTIFLFYVLFIVTLFSFIYLLLKKYITGNKLVISFTTIVISIRIILQYFEVPNILYLSDLFGPQSFAISAMLPSLGDLFLSVFCFFIIVLVCTRELEVNITKIIKKVAFKYTVVILMISASFLIYLIGLVLINNLILNSNISFDLSNFIELNYLSIIGLITIIGAFFSIFLIVIKVTEQTLQLIDNYKTSIVFTILIGIIFILLNLLFVYTDTLLIVLFTFLQLVITLNSKNKFHFKIANLIPLLLILSFITAIAMNDSINDVEKMRRKSIVRSFAINQDPQLEYLFQEIEKKVYKDSLIDNYFYDNNISFDSINSYLISSYFEKESQWKKYDIQSTICDSEQELVIKPENIRILCSDFFYQNLINNGSLTDNKNLYHIQYGTGQINYLGLLRFYVKTKEGLISYVIYIEIDSKIKRKGFTKLLSERGNDPFEKLKNYSLASYNDGKLIENYGNYNYPEIFINDSTSLLDMYFVNKNKYNHLVYKKNSKEIYVLSKKIAGNLAVVAPFSYLFILYTLLFVIFSFLLNRSILNWSFEANFTARLQSSMIAIIIVSFAIISYTSTHYISNLNTQKNNQRLKDFSSSLQLEFEHKVSNIDVSEATKNRDYLQTLSIKFSKVFDTDINLYNLEGDLIAGTRPEIFSQNLLSLKMNPLAYYKLTKEKESFYVTNESIGNLVYSSAYLPFHNSDKEVVAYLNLPYFARQSELQNEVSSFLITLMNVYTFIIVLAIIIILLISNYISRPLQMIKRKMQSLSLGSANEKIEWRGEDEIGKLVAEYNRMVDQMAVKAELLAKSEREGAWREMAKQVAHEIKNPLTPMKLSVQYLLRSWDDKDPDWEDRLHRLSGTLIEQIDTLSNIATAFSDFANMPKSNNERIDLNDIVHNAIELYSDYENLQITFARSNEQLSVYADPKQLLRVFNNLIKNSVQSFENKQIGIINIDIDEDVDGFNLHIKDNGCGIPNDKKDLIFVPNFTTKTKGTGLGLAMVKNIVISFGGTINFESIEGEGTVFSIHLPKYE